MAGACHVVRGGSEVVSAYVMGGRRSRSATAAGEEARSVHRFTVESPLYMALELVVAQLVTESVAPITSDGTQSHLQLATRRVNQ